MSAVTAKPAIPCFRCKKNHDSPTAFLLMCAKCQRTWHNGCHIPPVSSDEIIKRYDADRAGKRAAGLSSWQCRTCTKRSRLEPSGSSSSSAVPTRSSGMPLARTTTQPQPARAGQSSQGAISAPIVIAIEDDDEDDDIIMLDAPPPQLPRPATALAKPSVHTQGANSSTSQATSQTHSHAGLGEPRSITSTHQATTLTITRPPPRSLEEETHDSMSVDSDSTNDRPSVATRTISADASTQRKDKGKGREKDLGRLPREQESTRRAVLPGQQAGAAAESSHTAPSSSFFPSRPPPPPSAGPSEPRRAARPTRSPSPLPSSLSTQSRSQIRAEIVALDEQGRRAGSPTIEFTHTPHAQRRLQPTGAPIKRTAIPFSASSDLAKDNPGVDAQLSAPIEPAPQPEQGDISQRRQDVADDDPHNIDDLYGDIGSRYLNEAPPPRVEPPPRVDPPPRIDPPSLLLFDQRRKRHPHQDDLGPIIDKYAHNETQGRRPRKTTAKQLVGKDLKKKLEKGLVYFSADD